MKIQLKTLTPIWTGGVNPGQMDRLHETGIIGSLRWWYEAIVRGLGGDVCDPVSDNPEHRCQFDTKAYEKTRNIEDGLTGVCPACRLFGCAGWKRRFNLQVATTHEEPFWLATRDKPDKFNHWWLSQVYKPQESVVAWGQFTLGFHWIRGYETHHQTMQALVSLISHLGAIGAKSQYGFGIFSYTEAQSIPQSLAIVKQNLINPASSKNLRGNYPSINDFWLLRCDVPRNDADKQFGRLNIVGNESSFTKYKPVLLPVSFDIRYKLPGSIEEGLRQAYRLQHGKMPTRQLFGTLIGSEKDKRASSIFVSHLYKEDDSKPDYQLRVWAFAESKIMGEMQKSLQNIFPNLSCTQMKGSDLLDGVEARV
jgi:CRISPR-associated protein Cmr1